MSIQCAVKDILLAIGEDPGRDGLLGTPERVERALGELLSGYRQNPLEHLSVTFAVPYDELVLVKDIEFYSLCEHHLLPFYGKAHVGYIPRGRVVGLSKIARVVDCFARRLQVQERLTQQIAYALEEALNPEGIGVILQARHLCMMARGIAKQDSYMITSCLLGTLREQQAARAEFLSLCQQK